MIYRGFQDYIENRFSTAEEILETLCKVLHRSEFIKNSRIYLDGYTGFTPVQYRIAGLLLKYAKEVTVSITINPQAEPYKEESVQHLFYMGKHTVHKTAELAEKAGVKKRPDICLSGHPRFENAPAIGFLEKSLFRSFAPYPDNQEGRPLSEQNPNLSGRKSSRGGEFFSKPDSAGSSERRASVSGYCSHYRRLRGYGKEISHQFKESDSLFY